MNPDCAGSNVRSTLDRTNGSKNSNRILEAVVDDDDDAGGRMIRASDCTVSEEVGVVVGRDNLSRRFKNLQ